MMFCLVLLSALPFLQFPHVDTAKRLRCSVLPTAKWREKFKRGREKAVQKIFIGFISSTFPAQLNADDDDLSIKNLALWRAVVETVLF
jgi:hypothetical protein